ncbi:MAG: hypothetical protein ACKOJB_10000, partial [Chthoniobacterales bacterium]
MISTAHPPTFPVSAAMQFVRVSLALLVLAFAANAQKLTPLAQRPAWSSLDKFQGTITEEEFTRLLTQVYAPRGAWQGAFTIADNHVTVETGAGQPPFQLNFAPDAAGTKPVPRYWQPRSSLRGLR